MNTIDYDRIAGNLMDVARHIETSKRPGYTIGSDDVLANFKRVAERMGVTTEQAWGVYFLKHIDAITSIMSRPDLPVSEAPEGRFADAINYLRLGWAILQERGDQAAKVAKVQQVEARVSSAPASLPDVEPAGEYGFYRVKRSDA